MTPIVLSWQPPATEQTTVGARQVWQTGGPLRVECFETTRVFIVVNTDARRVLARKRTLAAAMRAAQRAWRDLLRGSKHPAQHNGISKRRKRRQKLLFA